MLQIQISTRGSNEPPKIQELTDGQSIRVQANQEITVIDAETKQAVKFKIEVQGENLIIRAGEPGQELSFTLLGALGEFAEGQEPVIFGVTPEEVRALVDEPLQDGTSGGLGPFEGLDPSLRHLLTLRLKTRVLDSNRDPIFEFSGGNSSGDGDDDGDGNLNSIDQRIVALSKNGDDRSSPPPNQGDRGDSTPTTGPPPDTTPPQIIEILRLVPLSEDTNADILTFRALFDEGVMDVDAADFVVTGSTASVTNVVQVDPSTYEITIGGGDLATLDGVVGLDLAPGQDIRDLAGNLLPAGEPPTDETYNLDNTAPVFTSLTRQAPVGENTNADILVFRATFDEAVQNLDATDFTVTGTTATITNVSQVDPMTFDLTVSGGDLANLNGTVGIDLAGSQDLTDAVGNSVAATEPATDETYDVDNTAPTFTSITRQTPTDGRTNADTLVFRATFSEGVENVDAADFTVTGTTGTISNLSQVNASTYDITVSGGNLASLNGTVGLDLAGAQDIADPAGNALPGAEPATDETYVVDNTAPTINTLSPADDSAGASVGGNLSVTFSEDIVLDTGNITIKNLTDNTQTTINVASHGGQLSVAGGVLTINPTADLGAGRNYAVQIDATAIDDTAGNSFAGISDDTTWNFQTEPDAIDDAYTTDDNTVLNVAAASGLISNDIGLPDGDLVSELGILDLAANGGINPATAAAWAVGDGYRLAFVSSGTRDASSTDIADYNNFVQTAAANSTAFGNLGSVTWNALASTATIDARDNTGTNPAAAGFGIFMLNGERIANDYNDLWDGEIDTQLDRTENGTLRPNDTPIWTNWTGVWTGTASDGTANAPLGAATVRLGLARAGTNNWINRATNGDNTIGLAIYGVSEELNVMQLPDLTVVTFDMTSARGATVSVNADGSFTYDTSSSTQLQALAVGDAVLTDTFSYTISDGTATDSATVTVTVEGANDAPVVGATADTAITETTDTSAITSSITIDFGDVDLTDTGHTTTITGASASGNTGGLTLDETALINLIAVNSTTKTSGSNTGSASLTFSAASTAFDYLPDGETVTITYTATVNDGDATGSNTFDVVITGTNDGPTAVADAATTDEDTALNISVGNDTLTTLAGATTVLGNDFDVDAPRTITGQLGRLDVSGINPATGAQWRVGDTYRLVFASSTGRDATSTDIADYNAFIQGLADAAGLGGATWNAIASTATVAANVNTSTLAGVGESIWLVNGTSLVAENYADLYGFATHSSKINLSETGGAPFDGGNFTSVWTGSDGFGGIKPNDELGDTDGTSHTGLFNFTSGRHWIDRFSVDNTDVKGLYGLSEVLTVSAPPDNSHLGVIEYDTVSTNGVAITMNADGTFTYDPNGQFEYLAAGEQLVDTFTYTITDDVPASQNPKLVAYYTLDNTLDDAIDDPDHPAVDATTEGTGGSFVFDSTRGTQVYSTGEDDRLVLGTQGIDRDVGFTWSFWANVASSNLTDAGGDVIIGTRGGNPWHKVDAGGSVSNWAGISYPNTTFANDTWQHVAYVGDSASVRLYVGGVLIGQDTTTPTSTFDGKFELGGSSRFSEDVTGLFSDVAVYEGALSLTDIQAIAGGAAPDTLFPSFETSTTTVTVTVDGVNDAPVVNVADSGSVTEDASGGAAETATSDSNPAATLVAHYMLNEGTPGTAVTGADDSIDDPTHPARDATVQGSGGMWVNDPQRGVVFSTTENDRLVLATSAEGGQGIDLNTEGFSWVFWVKTDGNQVADPGGDIVIGSRNGIWNGLSPTGLARWAGIGGYNIDDGEWHHVALVGTTDPEVRLYIDGALVGTDNTFFGGNLAVPDHFELGGSSKFSEDVTGYFSDVSIWRGALTLPEIQALAAGSDIFTDVDTTDTHTVSATYNNDAVWSGGTLTAGQIAAISSTIDNFTVDASGWDYTVDNADIDFLNDGETITLSFDVNVVDDSGAANNTGTEKVTITINGKTDATTITGTDGGTDSWNTSANWDNGIPGTSVDETIVAAGVTAQVNSDPPAYAGPLTLEDNATLQVNHRNAISVLDDPASFTMNDGSRIVIRDGSPDLGPIALTGSTAINFSSNGAHHETIDFLGAITGTGSLSVNGLNNDTFDFEAANSFSGGFVATSSANQGFRVNARSDDAFGTGDVTINNAGTLEIFSGLGDTIDDSAALVLNGIKDSRRASKLILGSNETIDTLTIDGVLAPSGNYTAASGDWISGGGTLTVLNGAVDIAPTLAPSGFVDSISGGPIFSDFGVFTIAVTFSEDMNAATLNASDFGNAGTAGITIGSITQTAAGALPNSPSTWEVEVTPTSAGTIRLQVNAGANLEDTTGMALNTTAAILDDTTITVNPGVTPPTTLTGTANGPNNNSRDSWNNAANWDNGIPLGPNAEAIIASGVFADVWNKGLSGSDNATPSFGGGLTLQANATLQIGWANPQLSNDANALGTGTITLNTGSSIVPRSSSVGNYTFNQQINLAGDATIWGGISTANHHTTKTFAGGITGAGELTYNGVNNTWFVFNTDNSTWTGGFTTADPQGQRHQVRASSDGAFGSGDVTLNNNASLEIKAGVTDAIDDSATLSINGGASSSLGNAKIELENGVTETVNLFVVDGVIQAAGTYGSTSSGATNQNDTWFRSGNSGVLTVLSSGVPPVVIDLGGDGFDLVHHNESMITLPMGALGAEAAIDWVGAEDAILLYDEDSSGTFSDPSEIVLTEHAPGTTSDLEALGQAFDTNGNGLLDATDARWSQFYLWQDLNQNAISEEGELTSLADAGVESIETTPSGERFSVDGVPVTGVANVNLTDGSTWQAGDVILTFKEVEADANPVPSTSKLNLGDMVEATDSDLKLPGGDKEGATVAAGAGPEQPSTEPGSAAAVAGGPDDAPAPTAGDGPIIAEAAPEVPADAPADADVGVVA